MDKNTWIGFLLIAAIIVGFSLWNRPSKEELAERQRVQDSIRLEKLAEAEAQRLSDSLQLVAGEATAQPETVSAEATQERLVRLPAQRKAKSSWFVWRTSMYD